MPAELLGWEWDDSPCQMVMWDGVEIAVDRGDTVAGYMTPDGTMIAVAVIKRPPQTLRPN